MATQAETTEQLRAALAAQVKTTAEIKTLLAAEAALKTANDALVAEKAALVLSNQQLATDKTALEAQVADLQAQLAALPPPTTGDTTADLAAVSAEVLAKSQENDALLPDEVVTPPPPPPSSEVFLRPSVPTPDGAGRRVVNVGLGTWSDAVGDYSSTRGQAVGQPDDPTKPGVAYLTVIDMSNSVPAFSPQVPWNATFFPDSGAQASIDFGGMTIAAMGQPFAVARGFGRWANSCFYLTNTGYVGSSGTNTAVDPWGGYLLPPNKKPVGLAVTSGTELVGVLVVDTDTGKGEIAWIITWGGQSLQLEALKGKSLPHDWLTPHPGLYSVGMVCGMKLLGYTDLGMTAPSGISMMTNRTQDRLQNKTDGNAGLLREYNLALQFDRDSFNLGHPTLPDGSPNNGSVGSNPNFLATSGTAVVISETENKAALIDMTPFFAGIKKQYTTTQELYDATVATGTPWWAAYSQDETKWPCGFTTRPDLAPVLIKTVAITGPTSVLVSQRSDGAVAIGCHSGSLLMLDHSLNPTGTSSLNLGAPITALTYDKFTGWANGGLFSLCHDTKTIYRISAFGPSASVTNTIADSRMVEPVAIEVPDTHGIDVGLLLVADKAGKRLYSYRYTNFTATNWGHAEPDTSKEKILRDDKTQPKDPETGLYPQTLQYPDKWVVPVYPIEGGAPFECEGYIDLPLKPVGISTTNVN